MNQPIGLARTTGAVVAGREALLAGRPAAAVALLEPVVADAPTDIDARCWLASAYLTARHPNATAAMNEARTLHALIQARAMGVDLERCQADPAYAFSIANQLYANKLVAISSEVRRLGFTAGDMDLDNLLSYGLSLQHQSRPEEACDVFRLAAEHFPHASVHQFLILPLLFSEGGEARHFTAAKEWAARYAKSAPFAPHANAPLAARQLRIGYVAPWFGQNQLKQFITPLLEHHDPDRVSITLYTTEAGSETAWPSWIDVHPIGGLSDSEAAALIRRDRIDVLADCWGHTAGSRLPVFAYRPAPVQIAWLNFVQTTGLDQIDYVLHADDPAPMPGLGELYTERIWRIGPVYTVFRASDSRLAPTPTPALSAGHVTFGSFNHPAKLSDEALDAWAAILRGAPLAQLLLKYSYFTDPVLQRQTQARFAARGVPPERIVFEGHSSGADYFRAFQQIDLMLDAWPATGSTTTLEALSNGAPVLVKGAPNVHGHYARSILVACGLHELVAKDAEDFVARGIALAHDVEGMNELRAKVRLGFDNGLLSDEVSFTRRVETALSEMFDVWWQSRQRRANG